MATRDELVALAAGGESELLEFKASTGERRAAMQTLCGMLNHRGGQVLFGVTADRQVPGQQIGDRTLEDLAQEIRELTPPALPQVDRVAVGGGREVIVVSVPQGPSRPYMYRGVPYRRLANTTSAMPTDEYQRILVERLHGEQRWENTAATGWRLEDLDVGEVHRTLDIAMRANRVTDPGTRDPIELLRGFGLLQQNGQLLRAAPVLFGTQSRLEAELPQCMLRVARFKGTDRAEFLDNRQFHGNIFTLLQHAERFLRDNLPVAGRVQPGLFERQDDPLYPMEALREALANAFCHRDYSIGGGSVALAIYDDRLEVTSTGTLHFGLTPAALYEHHESIPWNPLIARILYRRGLIESWGRGTLRIAELTGLAGLPRPEFEDSAGCVTVRFRPSWYVPPQRVAMDLTSRQRSILEILARSEVGLPLRQLRIRLADQSPEWEVKADLGRLRGFGLVEPRGHARGARWYLVREKR